MSATEKAALKTEILSLECRAEAIKGLLKMHADTSYLAQELAITLGTLDRIKVAAHRAGLRE